MPPRFVIASLPEHHAVLLDLNAAYLSWIFSEIDKAFGISTVEVVGMHPHDYAASVLDKLCAPVPPEGVFYLIEHEGRFAGMGGLRRLSDEVAEVKRIYVRPECRGAKLGERMFERLLADARQFGYQRVMLETAPFMKSAHRIYEAAGFVDRTPYEGAEVPEPFHDRWRFMERSLQDPPVPIA